MTYQRIPFQKWRLFIAGLGYALKAGYHGAERPQFADACFALAVLFTNAIDAIDNNETAEFLDMLDTFDYPDNIPDSLREILAARRQKNQGIK
jgi:hypothetical protein